MKINSILLGIFFFILSVLLTCACNNKAKEKGRKPVVIGAILPLTGGAAPYGVGLKKGVDLALDQVNKNGGINGHRLLIVVEDSQADPAKAVSAFNKLRSINAVPMVLGDMFSAGTLAIAPIAERNKIVILSPLRPQSLFLMLETIYFEYISL